MGQVTIQTGTTVTSENISNLLSFFHDRLKGYLKDKGHRHDHVDAVRIHADGTLEDDLVLIVKKLEAVGGFSQNRRWRKFACCL